MFPPIPSWQQAHPIVVHFPIALLMVVPLFLMLAGIRRAWTRDMMLVALVLTMLGTAAAALATATGGAAEDNVSDTSPAAAVLAQHEDLAELARNLFFGVTVLMALATALAWQFHHRSPQSVLLTGAVVMLALYVGPLLVLANAAHEGGRLVHEFGVRGGVTATGPGVAQSTGAPAPRRRGDDD